MSLIFTTRLAPLFSPDTARPRWCPWRTCSSSRMHPKPSTNARNGCARHVLTGDITHVLVHVARNPAYLLLVNIRYIPKAWIACLSSRDLNLGPGKVIPLPPQMYGQFEYSNWYTENCLNISGQSGKYDQYGPCVWCMSLMSRWVWWMSLLSRNNGTLNGL